MKRVEITREFVGLCYMQVCAAEDATDEEILNTCNKENPAGTTNGWMEVLREQADDNQKPVRCKEYPDRLHFLIAC